MAGKMTRRQFIGRGAGAVVLGAAMRPRATGGATPVTITHLDFVTPNDGSPRGNALANNLKAFAEAHPDIKVEVQTIPSTEIPQQLLKSTAAGKPPDVTKVHLPDLSAQVDAGTVEALDPFVSGWDKNDWLIGWDSTTIGGKKWAIPWDYRPTVLLYRKKILSDRGVAVPTTWAEVLAGAVKIGSDNPIGFGIGLSQSQNADSLAELFSCGMISAGGVMFNPNGSTAINSEAGVMTFQWIAELFSKGGTSKAAVNHTYFTIADGLAANTIAMTLLGSQRVAAVAATAKDDAGFAPPPGWSASKPGQSNPLSQTLVVSKRSKHKEEAIRFIEFMTGPRAAVELARGGEVPPRKSSYNDPFFATPPAANVSRLKEILLQRGGHVSAYPPKYWDLKQAIAGAAQSMVLQKRTPKEVLDEAAKKYNVLIGA